VSTGLEIEIIDIHSENKARLVLEGHQERIRSLTMMARRTKILAKSKTYGNSVVVQNTDFLISTGDDRTVRIWKIPPPLSTKQMRKMANNELDDNVQDVEYCILNIETRHEEPINTIVYLHESIATGAKDGIVKVYNLDMKFVKKEKKGKK
jgi:WD40 repeat protein